MNILVTLNSGLGADTGPNFNLTANVGSVTPSTATKAELLAGKFVDVDPSATQITVTSVGVCTTSIVLTITGQTTTTTTSAASSFVLGYNSTNFFTACTNYTSSPVTYYSTAGAVLQLGTTLYNDSNLTTTVATGFYSNGTDWFRCNFAGVVISVGSCSTTTTTSTSTTSTSTSTTTAAPTTSTTSTTTTLGPETFSLGYDASVGWQSCYASQSNYYANALETLANGLNLYTDITLDTPAPSGYYSNGANYWFIPPVCIEYTFTNNTGFDNYVDYIDCNGASQQIYVYDGTTSTAVCVDSILDLRSMTANNNGAGSCPPSTTGVFQDETPCPTTTTTSTTSTTSTSTSTTSTSTTSTSTSTSTTSTSSTTSTTTAAPTTTTTTATPTTTTTTVGTTTSTTTQPGDTTTTSTTTTAAPTTTTTTQAPCSLTIYFDASASPSPSGWDTQVGACAGTGTPLTVYFSNTGGCETTFSGVFNNGKALYTNSSLTTLLQGNDKFFKDVSAPNSGNTIQIGNDGFIDSIGDCVTTTTTTSGGGTTTTTTSGGGTTTTTTSGGGTTTTTTAATTTTTLAAAWYSLYSCTDGSTQNSTQKTVGTFAVNERVTFGGAFWYVLSELSSNPGGPLINVVSVGGPGVTGCPATTTTTTTTTAAPTTTTTTTAAPQCTYDGLTIVCDDGTTTTTTEPQTTTTTTTDGGTQLFIYAKYINSNGNLQYQINFGPIEQLGALTTTCDYITSIAVTVGDEITFSDANTKVIALSTTVCPDGPGGFGCSAGYSVLISGTQYVYLTIDGSTIC